MLVKTTQPKPTKSKFVVMAQRSQRYSPMIGHYLEVSRIWIDTEESAKGDAQCQCGPFDTYAEAKLAAEIFNNLWLVRPITQ